MAKIAISTAQNVNLDYKIVGLGERVVAFLIDAIILFTYMSIMETLVSISEIFDTDQWTQIGFLSLFLLPAFFYSLLFNILFQGRTIGKLIMKIKVVRADGSPTEWYQLFVRWMLRIIDIWMFFAAIGVGSILFSDKKQRVGDAAAGTIVISTKKKDKITSTILEEIDDAYEPTYTNVTLLTDADMRIVKEVFTIAVKTADYRTLKLLRNKICGILQIETEEYDRPFIDKILKDYNYYTQQM